MNRSRMRMRLHLFPHSAETTFSMGPPDSGDLDQLAELMLGAYSGGTDVDGNETVDEAREEIQRTFDGTYGEFMPGFSSLVTDDSRIVAATLITLYEDHPLVTFTMTHPDWKRQGLGRATLCRSINLLIEAKWKTLDLVVTISNTPAINLYRNLGFREIESGQPDG